MAPTATSTANCKSCNHLGFCSVNWGPDCKRQGGKKTPRMKSMKIEVSYNLDKKQSMNSPKYIEMEPEKIRSRNMQIFEPIRTKMASW